MTIQLPGTVIASGFEYLFSQKGRYPESNEDRRTATANPSYHHYLSEEEVKEEEVYRIDMEPPVEEPSHHKIVANLTPSSKRLLPRVILEHVSTFLCEDVFPKINKDFYLASKLRVYQLVKKLSTDKFFSKEISPPSI